MKNKIWKFLNSGFFLLILGFTLTSILGTLLSDRLQRKAWEKEKRFEIAKRKLEEGQHSLEKISDLINLRFYRLQNVFILISKKDLVNAEKAWNRYMETVEEWNVKLIINKNKIKRLVNHEKAELFNNFETDDPELKEPYSIHGKFFVCHQKILNQLRCLKRQNCSVPQKKKEEINNLLRELDYESDYFIDEISTIFLYRTIGLETFQPQKSWFPKRYKRMGYTLKRIESYVE